MIVDGSFGNARPQAVVVRRLIGVVDTKKIFSITHGEMHAYAFGYVNLRRKSTAQNFACVLERDRTLEN